MTIEKTNAALTATLGIHLLRLQIRVCMHLVFTHMPGESYRRQFRSLPLRSDDAFQVFVLSQDANVYIYMVVFVLFCFLFC